MAERQGDHMSYEEKTKKLIVGIDHGFAMMKHTHGEFSNGLTKIPNGASIVQNTLIYGGQTYKIGEGRLPMKEDKVSDEDYFILTVAAICEEMKHFNTHEAFVTIAAGLPFSRYGVEKDAFQQYLNRSGEIKASLEGEEYVFTIEDVLIYPQCYAAVVKLLNSMDGEALAVDIGSKTIDIVHIVNHVPSETKSTSVPGGMILVIENIKNQVFRQTNRQVTDSQILSVLQEEEIIIPEECITIIRNGFTGFAAFMESKIAELGFDPKMIQIVYAGGGARIMRRFSRNNGKNVLILEDIRANAVGYEYLCKLSMDRR